MKRDNPNTPSIWVFMYLTGIFLLTILFLSIPNVYWNSIADFDDLMTNEYTAADVNLSESHKSMIYSERNVKTSFPSLAYHRLVNAETNDLAYNFVQQVLYAKGSESVSFEIPLSNNGPPPEGVYYWEFLISGEAPNGNDIIGVFRTNNFTISR